MCIPVFSHTFNRGIQHRCIHSNPNKKQINKSQDMFDTSLQFLPSTEVRSCTTDYFHFLFSLQNKRNSETVLPRRDICIFTVAFFALPRHCLMATTKYENRSWRSHFTTFYGCIFTIDKYVYSIFCKFILTVLNHSTFPTRVGRNLHAGRRTVAPNSKLF